MSTTLHTSPEQPRGAKVLFPIRDYFPNAMAIEVDGSDIIVITIPEIGTVQMLLNGTVAKMSRLFVGEHWRRRRIGARLVKACVDTARAMDMLALAFSVEKDNEAAINLYAKMGAFITDEVGKDYWMAIPTAAPKKSIADAIDDAMHQPRNDATMYLAKNVAINSLCE